VMNDGNGGANYAISYVPSAATGVITQAGLTVTADWPQGKLQGYPDPALSFTITSGSLATPDALSGTLVRAPGETPGLYPIGAGSLSAGPNYQMTFVSTDFVIAPLRSALDEARMARSVCDGPLAAAETQSEVSSGSAAGKYGWDAACGALGIRVHKTQPLGVDLVSAEEAVAPSAAGRAQ